MFEEAQLYAPVTRSEGGDVTVHLSDGHPGAVDPPAASTLRQYSWPAFEGISIRS